MDIRTLVKLGWGAAAIGTVALGGGLGMVAAQAANEVHTSYATGYQKAPAYYDLSQGPAIGTFSYTVTNLTTSTIDTNVEFIADRILTYEGIDVSDGQPGQPGLTESELGANFAQTTQQYNVVYETQPLSLAPSAVQTVTFGFQLTECGYYQFDSDAVHNAVPGLFATGFTRVIGCTPPKPLGDQGCTPGFWKNQRHYSLWTGYSPTELLSSVFDVPATFPDGSSGASLSSATLAEALAFRGGSTLNGAAQILLRAATSSLLNASSPGVAFSMTTAQIVSSVDAALSSGSRTQITDLATTLDDANNGVGGCPLS